MDDVSPVLDRDRMLRAVDVASRARHRTSPNPWVGVTLVQTDGSVTWGATEPAGGNHAEIEALAAAEVTEGATVYTTLEPCNHHGRTGPCTEALIEAGIARVVIGVTDPDPHVAGAGIERLRAAGIRVDVGVAAEEVERQLRPYLHHRRTGRPWVVLKLAASIDGRVAAPDGSSQWITGPEARADAHRLRAESDAILVGAGTVRADDPALTVRDWPPPELRIDPAGVRDPRRVVLGAAPADARVHPCLEFDGEVPDLLDQLGADEVVQLMVEGGPRVAHTFHHQGLVDEYVIYLAPVLFAGGDAAGLFAGAGAVSIDSVWRGRFDEVVTLGADLRVTLLAHGGESAEG
ncbi:MAG: bifunctional diaminohydroxyphosphoribosylaminopyrimidine deaminase/5-amino-6-(5-phosphoribosylamino)uracil reductase RibD [Acidimicrobiales bacterium]